jgi:hypothetical protein
MLTEKNKFYFSLLLSTAVMAYIVITAEVFSEMSDAVQHYLISRYSWQHPHLFLDHWGKPFFILLSSPFAQFGTKGIALFNVLCGAATSYFLYRICSKTKLKHIWLLPVFVFFSPVYFAVVNSGLTEPCFGLVLVASIFLFTEKKFNTAVLLISFLPFVRSEGYLILPLFGLLLLIRKKYFAIPLLAFGWLVYALIGWIALGDFLWQFSQNPYRGGADIYGHGSLLHFISALKNIWGIVLFWLFAIGVVIVKFNAISAWRKKILTVYLIPEELFLIAGSFAVYFIAHSIFWWQGIYGSLGLIRVIAAVMPCAAYLALVAVNKISDVFGNFILLKTSVLLSITILILVVPFREKHFPYRLEAEQLLTKDAGEWYVQQNFNAVDYYYLLPYFSITANIDPFAEQRKNPWRFNSDVEKGKITKGAVIIWDGHFGPNELGIDLNALLNNPEFDLLKKLTPSVPFKTLNNYDFEIYVFRKK